MARPQRTCSTLIACSLLVLLPGCTGESSPTVAPSTTPAVSSPPHPQASETPLPDGVRLMSDLQPGTPVAPGRYAGVFAISTNPAALPLAVVTVPEGYLVGGPGAVYNDAGGWRELNLWVVSEVATDACTDSVAYVDPGSTARDLADALTALPVWRSSTPKPVTVGGYDGLVMDFDVPDPMPKSCGDEPDHWIDDAGGTQAVGPGKRQRLWILDVEGQRVVVMAGWFPAGGSDGAAGVTPDLAAELVHMAEGITFVAPTT